MRNRNVSSCTVFTAITSTLLVGCEGLQPDWVVSQGTKPPSEDRDLNLLASAGTMMSLS